jgi:hypothetical protein
MTGLIIIAALLAAFALAAPRFGADTHTSDGWTGGRGRRGCPDAGAVWTAATAAIGARRRPVAR